MNTKEKVLRALEKGKGTYISGEMLAGECNVSRNAIWKSIAELKKSGYPIKSVTNRGYMLEETSDIISRAGICMYLDSGSDADEGGKICSEKVFVYDTLDSTNNEAKRNLIFSNDSMTHGTVFVARQQTAGRGHSGSSFSSPEGGIYFSVILEPEMIRKKDIPVTTFISDTVTDVLKRLYQVKTERRRDSSVYVGSEKVCGILTEGISDLETGEYSNYIAGIGIRAEKLRSIHGLSPQRNRVIAEIIGGLSLWW